jgi:hypothetical protein
MSPSQGMSFSFVHPTLECTPHFNLSLIYSPETRLSELSKTVRTSGSSASSTIGAEDGAPTIPTPEIRQIMKRVPGKSARDGEDDAKSESSQSQVLSHEERQAKYEQTRARIFSDYVASQGSEAAEKGSDGDGGSESNPPFYQ